MRQRKRRLIFCGPEKEKLDELMWKYCFPHMQSLLFYAVRSAFFRREEFFVWLKPVEERGPYVEVSAYLCEKDYQFLLRCARRLKLKVGKGRGMGIIAYRCVLFALGEKDEGG